MYSLMSMRTSAVSSSNMDCARPRASSVLPTPVGPRNRNEPIGRRGFLRPARARRTASEPGAVRAGRDTARAWRCPLCGPAPRVGRPVLMWAELAPPPLEQTADREAGPGPDDVGDVVGR